MGTHLVSRGCRALAAGLLGFAALTVPTGAGAQTATDAELQPFDTSGEKEVGLGERTVPAEVQRLEASTHRPADDGATVVVEVLHDSPDSDVHALITALGGEVTGTVPGELTEATIPADRVADLGNDKGVEFVRRPLLANMPLLDEPVGPPVQVGPTVGQEIQKTNADDWHAAGETGAGVTVGIVDYFDSALWASAQAAGEVPAPASTFCRFNGGSCDLWSAGSAHGVAVAEIVHEMAPGATIHIATAITTADLQAVVNHFDAVGVDIITRSLGAEYDGPGDGTGPLASVLDDAVGKGMTWFNSAGNSAGGAYWRGNWNDGNGNGFLDFNEPGAPFPDVLSVNCRFAHGLRWNDWGPAAGRTDYDLVEVFSDGSWVSLSIDDQQAGAPPLEEGHGICDGTWRMLAVGLWNAGSGTSGDNLEFMVNLGRLGLWQDPYSAGQPISDSANPGGVSVGAIDPALGSTIAAYSSRGPLNDSRVKPDLSAAACVNSHVYAPECFNGTSAASPTAAGAAALVKGANPAFTPAQLTNWLYNNAMTDRGSAGRDNTYGWGEVILPAPTPTTHQLMVTKTGLGSGTVTSSPPGINCGGDCSETYPVGTTVTLTATPGADSEFEGWGGACSGTGTCQVTMTAARHVTASFSLVGVQPPSGAWGEFTALTPNRVLDTRSGVGTGGVTAPLGPRHTIDVQITGRGGVPSSGVQAVVMNVTSVGPSAWTYLSIWPKGVSQPNVSNLNTEAGTTRPNLVTVKVGIGGKVKLYNWGGATHVLFDVAGFYTDEFGPDGSRFRSLDPQRIADTRSGLGGIGSTKIGPNETRTIDVTGVGGVPANDVTAVVLNATIAGATAWSYLTVSPSDVPMPNVSNLNYVGGDVSANQVIVRVPANGMIDIYNAFGHTDVIIDVFGYYADTGSDTTGRFTAWNPERLVDTRNDPYFPPPGRMGPGDSVFYGAAPNSAAVLNVTVTEASGYGYMVAHPHPGGLPPTSTVNYNTGDTVANHAVVRCAPDMAFTNMVGTTHLVVDLFGVFS